MLVAVAVLIALGSVLIKSYGSSEYRRGKADAVASVNAEVVKEGKKHEKKKLEIRNLSNDDLVRRYCKWVYDVPYAECLRTVRIVE